MLKLFNSNTPLVLVLLPIIMLPFWGLSFWTDELHTFEQASFVFKWIWIENPFINKCVAFVFVVLSGIQLNLIINNNEFFDKNTYLPSMLYVLFMSSFGELQQMHPIIISNLFWILAYRRLMNVYNQVQCKSEIFDASLFFVLAGVINPPYSLFMILFSWITLALIRPFDTREYAMPIFASVLMGTYLTFYHYFFLPIDIAHLQSAYSNFHIEKHWHYYVIYGLLILIMYGSAYKLISISNKSSIRFRKISSKLMTFIMLSLVVMLDEKLLSQNDAFILYGAVPLSILFSFLFYHNAGKWHTATLFYSLLGVLLFAIYS